MSRYSVVNNLNRMDCRAKALLQIATVVLAIVSCWLLVEHAIAARESASDKRMYILVSNLAKAKDFSAIEDSTNGLVLFRTAESDLGRSLKANVPNAQQDVAKYGWVLVTRLGPNQFSASSTTQSLQSALNQARTAKNAAIFPIVPWCLLVGLAIGCFLIPNATILRFFVVSAAGACAYRLFSGCVSCEIVFPLGKDIALVGCLGYGLLALVLIISPLSKCLVYCTGFLTVSALTLQLLLQVYVGGACAGCAAAALFGSILLACISGKLSMWFQIQDYNRSLRLTMTAVLFVIVAMVVSLSAPGFDGNGITTEHSSDHQAIGRMAKDIGVDHTPNQSEVIAITKSGCHPCDELKLLLSKHPECRIRYLDVGAVSPKKGWSPRATPLLLFVSADGRVADEAIGWSPDIRWQETYLTQIRVYSVNRNVRR